MEPTTLPAQSRVHNITAEGMHFTITETLRASMVEIWICAVKQRFLDVALIKCVGLDYEFTSPREGRRDQRAAVLQFSVASEVLVFQLCQADHVPQLLKEFLKDTTIRFCGAAIDKDVHMLRSYGIEIPSVYDLQRIIPNPTNNPIPSLSDLSNATIGTKLEKKKRNKKDNKKDKKKDDKEEEEEYELVSGWAKVPLSGKQVLYTALDARLGFKIARRHWKLQDYNIHVDHLNI
jgi:ribonuclease D